MEHPEECHALEILKSVFGDCYSTCKTGDRPDIQAENGSCGIEVTRATNPERVAASQAMHADALNSIGDMRKVYSDSVRDKIILKSGGKLYKCHGLPVYETQCQDAEEVQKIILERIEDKQGKLSEYSNFERMQLFVFDETDSYENDLYIKMINAVLDIYKKNHTSGILFEKIFILKHGITLYELDIPTGCVEIHQVPNPV